MKALKLLKRLTPVYKLLVILTCSLYLNLTHAETAGSQFAPDTPENIRLRDELSCKSEIRANAKEFKTACSKAGLGSGEICAQKILDCEDITPDDDADDLEGLEYCPAVSAKMSSLEKKVERLERKKEKAEEKEDKLKDEIEKKTQAYHDTNEEINALVEERNLAKEEFEAEKTRIGSDRLTALSEAKAKVEQYQLEIESTQDQITNIYIGQRAAMVENKLSCRTEAVKKAQQIEEQAYANKRAGKTYLDMWTLLARGGKSARDEAIEAHDRYMRSCTSIHDPYNNRKLTPFGDRYTQKKIQDRLTINQLRRRIRTLDRQKAVAKRFYEDSLNNLSRSERDLINKAIAKEQSLAAKARQLKNKMMNIQFKLVKATQDLNKQENIVRTINIDLQEAEAALSKAEAGGVSDEKTAAFREAESLIEYQDQTSAINSDCLGNTQDAADIELQADTVTDATTPPGETTDGVTTDGVDSDKPNADSGALETGGTRRTNNNPCSGKDSPNIGFECKPPGPR